jgi:hypothetical protein
MTPAVAVVLDVAEIAAEASLTRTQLTATEELAGPKLAAFSKSAVE